MSDPQTCGAPTESGGTCGVTFGLCDEPGCGRCWTHDPHRSEEREAANSRGGYRAARGPGTIAPGDVPPAPRTLQDAVVWAAWAARAAATGELDTGRANAAARLLKEFRQALERTEAKAELEELRRKLEELGADGPDLGAVS